MTMHYDDNAPNILGRVKMQDRAPAADPLYRHPSGMTNADLLRIVNSFERLDTLSVNGVDGYRRVTLAADRERNRPRLHNPTIDPPATTGRVWNAESIQRALLEHQLGMFQTSAYLAEALMSDARVSHAINARTKGILKRKVFFQAPKRAKDQKKAKRIADQMTEIYGDICPLEFQEALWSITPLLGFSLFNCTWDEGAEGLVLPTFRNWHTSYTFFLMSGNLEERRLQAISMGGGETQQSQTIPIEETDENWFHFHPFGAYRGWLRGCLLQVAVPWLVRNLSLRDWSRCSEVHGVPIRIIKVPASASEPDKARLFEEAGNLGSEAVFVLPVAADGSGFDVTLLEPHNAKSWEVFSELGHRCDSDIEISIVGTQLLAALGDQGAHGRTSSMAASGNVQKENDDYSEQDAMHFCEAFRRGPLTRIVRYNNVDADDCVPTMSLTDEPPADKAQTATAMAQVSTALVNFAQAGAEVVLEAIREEFGTFLTGKKITPVLPSGNGDKSGDSGGGDSGVDGSDKVGAGRTMALARGSMTVQSILLAKSHFTREAALAWLKAHDFDTGLDEKPETYRARQREPGDFAAGSMRTISVTSGVQAVVGRLKVKANVRLEKARPSHKGGQEYTDAVLARAMGLSALEMAPHVAEVMAAVDAAQTPAELRRSLKVLARGIKRGRLETLVRNSRIMAHGAGRLSEVRNDE